MKRCAWAGREPLIAYHDREWGVPQHDNGALFEFLILEGAPAGLSRETIPKRRDTYRAAFDAFDPVRVTPYGEKIIGGPPFNLPPVRRDHHAARCAGV